MIKPGVILLLAAIWDYIIGDPKSWIHPVQVMGWIIFNYTQLILKFFAHQWLRRFAGFILGLGLIVGSGVTSWFVIQIVQQISPLLAIALQVIILASCFAGKSLRVAAEDVLMALKKKDLPTARSRLSMYVGRDTENLSETEILRAILETVGENTVDGVTSPLFYGILGAFVPLIGSIPLAVGYKAASTLDSMIGYLREPYTDIGWFSAKLEDGLTWLPCRLTVLTLALFSRKPRQVLAICRRDAILDPSPNSGWSECIYAAIFGVQLGGINTYQGVMREKPLLGNSDREISSEIVQQALQLTRWCFLCWIAIAILVLLSFYTLSSV